MTVDRKALAAAISEAELWGEPVRGLGADETHGEWCYRMADAVLALRGLEAVEQHRAAVPSSDSHEQGAP